MQWQQSFTALQPQPDWCKHIICWNPGLTAATSEMPGVKQRHPAKHMCLLAGRGLPGLCSAGAMEAPAQPASLHWRPEHGWPCGLACCLGRPEPLAWHPPLLCSCRYRVDLAAQVQASISQLFKQLTMCRIPFQRLIAELYSETREQAASEAVC